MANVSGLPGFDDRRRSRFVADNKMDSTPSWPTFFGRKWTTPPTKVEIGGFGVDTNGRLCSTDGTKYMPVVGNRQVIDITADTVLTADNAGALIAIGSTTGRLITLPTPRPGMEFEIELGVTIASRSLKIITDSASVFLRGAIRQSTDSTFTEAIHLANGTTIRSINLNGTTTGGYAGDGFQLRALSTTIWIVSGRGAASGSEATPFGTS